MEDWNRNNPEEAAKYCADTYPPTVLTPDTVWKEADSSGYIKSIEDYQKALDSLGGVNDSLFNALTEDEDCTEHLQLVVNQRREIDRLKREIVNVKPIIKEVLVTVPIIDTKTAARLAELEFANGRLEIANGAKDDTISELETKLAKAEGKSKTRWWMIIALALASLFIVYLLIRRR